MSWVTIIWSMVASACLTLAALHALVWWRHREAWANLLFSLTAAATAVQAGTELWAMVATTPEEFGRALWWAHLPFWLVIVSLVGFVRLYLRAGRRWLAWTVCGLRTLALILNFFLSPNINYREITALGHLQFLGAAVSVPEGVPNPWMLVGQLGSLLFISFVADATLAVWRRGGRQQAVVLGCVILFFVIVATVQPVLTFWGIVQMPITISLFYMGVVAAMGFELSRDVIRAAQLARELQASEAGLSESEARTALAASQHKQAEEARNNLAAIVESSDDAILSKTLDGTITSWNTGAEKMYGYLAREMVGQHVCTLAPVDLKEEVSEILERLKLGESVDHLETARTTKDGRRIDVSLTISPIKDEHGMITGASTIARDITERKRAELEALQQRSELAHLSRVTMLSELSSSLAHELNQPLGAILRNTEAAELFLQDPSPDLEELRAILVDIRKDDQRAGAVIDRMRSMLKRREVEQRLLDLNVVVSEVISLVRTDADSRKVQLMLEAASSLPPVRGDRVQLQQVLLNLLLNAMDAVNDSAPDLRRVTVRMQSTSTLVEITVIDTGPGIPSDKLARLFEPFFTTKANGMGMGLPISRTIMEAHHGSIRAENDPAGGAKFYLMLPVAKEESSS